jgi:tRNA A37 threonylcarbamoyladenosine biosynthesis protein TsaE
LKKYLNHITLTQDQQHAVDQLQQFLEGEDRIFILQGYAGTGKTTLLKGVVDYLVANNIPVSLMAPTGRAARILQQKTKHNAGTIHREIYGLNELEEIEMGHNDENLSFMYRFGMRKKDNIHNAVLIVDEASMVSDKPEEFEFFQFGSGSVLNDLMEYARIMDPAITSKVIFVGDPAQLPPVGMNISPALDPETLDQKFHTPVKVVEMREVKRQDAGNGILEAAGHLRNCIKSGFFNHFDLRSNNQDLIGLKPEEFLPFYLQDGGSKIVITYKNKTALALNQRIRKELFADTSLIQESDIVVCGSNNHALDILNGEFAVVSERSDSTVSRDVHFQMKGNVRQRVRLVWRRIHLLANDAFQDDKPKIIEGFLLENFLYGENQLLPEERRALYIDFKQRYPHLKKGTQEFVYAMKHDLYFNCLLMKFGYAVTCHKAQGGEWDSAYIYWEKGMQSSFGDQTPEGEPAGRSNLDFYRWAYTAATRASKRLHNLFEPYFSPFSKMGFVSAEVQAAHERLVSQRDSVPAIAYDDVLPAMQRFRVQEEAPGIQEHFADRWHRLRQQDIEIISWLKVGFEVRYIFRKAQDTAAVKYWLNGKGVVGAKYDLIAAKTNSMELYHQVTSGLDDGDTVSLEFKVDDVATASVAFDESIATTKPFLKLLYDKLKGNLAPQESISDITHLDYKERYTIASNGKWGVFDFEYDGSGFFGRVLYLEKKSNNPLLVGRIKEIIQAIKEA